MKSTKITTVSLRTLLHTIIVLMFRPFAAVA
jgi:hypothetical protein